MVICPGIGNGLELRTPIDADSNELSTDCFIPRRRVQGVRGVYLTAA